MGERAIQNEVQQEAQVQPAGYWIRSAAYSIDVIILSIVQMPLSYLMGMMNNGQDLKNNPELAQSPEFLMTLLVGYLASLCIVGFWYGWFYKNKGGSPGKLILGLHVYNSESGENLGYMRTFFREFVGKMLINTLTLGLGYLLAGLRKDKKALHDIIFGSQVIKK